MKRYSMSKTEIRPHYRGTHVCLRDEEGKMVGEINAHRLKKVDSLDFKAIMKGMLREGEPFEDLARRAAATLPQYAENLEIRYIF